IFNGLDQNKDGKVAISELEGNRMADRLKTLDADGDESISQEEFTSGMRTLFSGGRGGRGGGGGRPGGGRPGGGGRYGGGNAPQRPDRPQRPATEGGL
ncbi:MAG: hypothetical protein AAFP90_22555, partial [Planctomycetota bacterium]